MNNPVAYNNKNNIIIIILDICQRGHIFLTVINGNNNFTNELDVK